MDQMLSKLRDTQAWRFFATLPRASRWLAITWWALIVLGGLLPALFSVAVGVLVSAIQRETGSDLPLILLGVVFIAILVHTPVISQVGANLGDRLAMWLYDTLLRASTAPPGVAHLESHEVVGDLAVARDFDMGMSGPSLALSIGIISTGLQTMVTGLAQAALLFAFHWWAPIVILGAWGATLYRSETGSGV